MNDERDYYQSEALLKPQTITEHQYSQHAHFCQLTKESRQPLRGSNKMPIKKRYKAISKDNRKFFGAKDRLLFGCFGCILYPY